MRNNQSERYLLKEGDFIRRIAYSSILLSTFCVTIAVVIIPSLFINLQHLESEIQDEINFCNMRKSLLHNELDVISVGITRRKRSDSEQVLKEDAKKRIFHFNFPGEYKDGIFSVRKVNRACCSCAYGPAGKRGIIGDPGKPGVDGRPGHNGLHGEPAKQPPKPKIDWCFDCPSAPSEPGAQGLPGKDGIDGIDGLNGKNGRPGQCGKPGPKGVQGPRGEKGKSGNPGLQVAVDGNPGPPGLQGPPGKPGSAGRPGRAGTTGATGAQGLPGERGKMGKKGGPGANGAPGIPGLPGTESSCDHCPPPLTPPGYQLP